MKTTEQFLSDLNNLDIKLWLDGDLLRCNAPKDALTSELKAELQTRKEEILQLIRQVNSFSIPTQETILPVPRTENISLSYAQQRLWFLAQLEPENPFYNQATALKLTGQLNIPILKQSLEELLKRHEPLRTTFSTNSAGKTAQIIHPSAEIPLPIIDLEQLNSTTTQQEIEKLANLEAQKIFNLEKDLLLRVTLLRLSPIEHIVLFTTHHIITDEWSTGILVKEIATFYQAFLERKPSPLPELPIQYADFAIWQRKWLTGEVLSRQLNYWQQQLQDLPRLDLPTDYSRPANTAYQGAKQTFELSPSLTAGIKALAQKEGVTLFMTMLAAFQVLLSRYSNQEDIAIGTPIANRNRGEIESLIGFFVNTLVLRINLKGNPSFRELLQRTREVTLAAYTHQDIPFEQLVEELKVERQINRNPLFDVMFTIENGGGEELTLPGLTISYLEPENHTAIFALILSIGETETGFSGTIEYSTELFKHSTIERMVAHFQVLLYGIVSDPEAKISELPLLTQSEQSQLLLEWNNTKVEYPQDKCIHQLFEEQVEKTPDAIAVVFEEEQLTYGELNHRANQLAEYLQKQGVKPEVLVGICLERSLSMTIAILGVLKAGAAYVPLDPSYPNQRITEILEDAGVETILTQQQLETRFEQQSRQLVHLDKNWSEIAERSTGKCSSQVNSENLAYVIYTSGSTGKPKGVAVNHNALVNYTLEIARQFELQKSDRFLQFASIGFDVVVEELFPTWITGATVVLLENNLLISCKEFQQLIEKQQLTVFELPTAYWHQWVSELSSHQEKVLSSVRLVLVGGERISPERLKQWQQLSTPLIHVYGLTETTVTSTLYRLNNHIEVLKAGTDLPIGKPVANTEIYLLDSQLQPVPIGVEGEIYIGGEGLARGYLNRPELTAQRFIPNSFSKDAGERLYRTGDKACYLENGDIEYIGRIDHQIKLRGFRIELGEIESTLDRHSAVATSVVILREDAPDNQSLVAYVTLQPEQIEAISSLRSYLEIKLPRYMMPSAFVILESLPLTPNGKVDRKALPVPDSSNLITEEEYLTPATPTQEILANIWQEIIGIERIGIQDNFFDLGGHSLIATRVVSQIRQIFNIELSLRSLFEKVTIEDLAQEIETATKSNLGLECSSIQTILPVPRTENISLSYAQQRLWFLAQLEPENPFYNQATALKLTGQLNIPILKQSLEELLKRHEPLRTTFSTNSAGKTAQIIHPSAEIPLPIIDLEQLNSTTTQQEIEKLANLEAQKIFNLEKDLLLRVTLLRLSPIEHIVLFTTHHIITDEWSTGILVKEIATFYQAFLERKPSPLPELPIQYADFAIWQRKWLTGEVLSRQLNYWQQQLQDLPRLDLPTDYSRPANTAYQGAKQTFELSPSLTAGIKALAQKEGVTLFMTMLAAFQVLLSRYSNQEDIAIGTPIANRNRGEIESLIGFFVNTLVLRINLKGNPSFRELLQRTREVTLAAYTHQDIPFEQLVEELKVERQINRNPLFDVMFTIENGGGEELTLPGLTISYLEPENHTAIFALILSIGETETGFSGTIEYSTELFKHSTIERMVAHFQVLLYGIVSDPEAKISELPLLTQSEQSQLLLEWNNTKVEYPQDKCIHQLFEEQVEKTPDAIAVVFEEEQLTYGELNHRANQLAEYLQKQGVKPEVLVGICLERSLSMVIGLLGILKAGGAYVPLDPSYPQERLAFILEDAQASVLLTQASLLEEIPRNQAQVICVDIDWHLIARQSQENISSQATTDNLAYVIYTSGSTGKPKGVQISHLALSNFLDSMKKAPGLGSEDTLLAVTTYSFDIAALELFLPIIVGARLVVVSREIVSDGVELSAKLINSKATVMQGTPATWQLLLAADWNGDRQLKILCGGEALSGRLANQLLDRCNSLWNMYGPTETTIWSAASQVEVISNTASISSPITNTQLYILNRDCQLVPVGVIGELFIGGKGLARGYFHRPDLTAEKFIPNPFSQETGSRLYRTGDLARYWSNGEIEYIGRIDNQVKIRGFRIELGEIEAVICQYPAVRETVVVLHSNLADSQQIVAYVVPQKKQALTISELSIFLDSKLPNYMLPTTIVILEALPLTPNGKVDRKALPVTATAIIEKKYVAPRTPTEGILVNIWQEVLNSLQVGIYDNFFELGGHSLLATRLIFRLKQVFKIELPLRSLFENPTIASLAEYIQTSSNPSQQQEIKLVSRTEKLPLSFAQQRLWFHAQLEPNSPDYNLPATFTIQGNLNVVALQQSFNKIIERHEILRTSLIEIDGEAVQVIAPSLKINLEVIERQELVDTQLQQIIQAEALKSFDLSKAPLFRIKLLRFDSEKHILIVVMHHIISDFWSEEVLLQELTTLYESKITQKPITLPDLLIQYADFAMWQRQYLQGEILENHLNYWRQQLEGDLPVLNFPSLVSQVTSVSNQGGIYNFAFDKDLSDKIQAFNQKEGATLFITLLTVFKVLLSIYTKQEDIIIGTPIANRDRLELEPLIGFFVNTLLLRTNLSGNPSFQDLLGRVREVTLNGYAHQALPFEKLVEVLQPNRQQKELAFLQVWFTLTNAGGKEFHLPDVVISEIDYEMEIERYQLRLDIVESPEGLKGSFGYKTDLFEFDTIAFMARNLETIFCEIITKPTISLTELTAIITQAEQEQKIIREQELAQKSLSKFKTSKRRMVEGYSQSN
jgi:amino acid adenylation domain-containing protein